MKKPYLLTTINGIKTVLYPIKDLPSIRLELMVRTGSYHEKGKNWGAFHLIEHLTLQGTELFPTSLDIELYNEDHGLSSNAYTGGSSLGYWVKAPHYSLEQAIILLNQAALKPTFPKSSFKKELSVITQEYRDKWDNPYNRFSRAINVQFYGADHPYIRDGIGQPEYISILSREQLQKLHSKYFTSSNMILSITGNFTPKTAIKLLKKYLLPTSKKATSQPKIPPRMPTAKVIRHYEDVQQDRLAIHWPLPGRDELTLKQMLTINIAKYILGGSARSRLFQELREKRGLVYRTGAYHYFNPKNGYFEVWCSTDPIHTKEATKAMKQIVADFINEPIDPETFTRAVSFMNASTITNLDSIDEISNSITNDLFYKDKIYLPQDYIDTAKTITAKQVQNIIKKYLVPTTEQISIMTKKK